jgi:putative ABC transport system ATP-binding protein
VRRTAPATGSGEPGVVPGGIDVHLDGVVHLYHRPDSDVVALRGVDLDVDAGAMVALLGPSGMGKTTVLRIMAGVVTPSAGRVRVGVHDLGRLPAARRRTLRATEIGYLVQGTAANVLPFASAVSNLWFAQHGARLQGKQPWPPEQVLELLGLDGLGNTPLARLPLGVQQQIAVAGCVAAGPRLLLADEPTASLSPEAGDDVVRLLQRINGELGTTVVIVTHDPHVARQFPRTVTIRDGRVGAEGRHGAEYAVVDRLGSVQLPPDVLELLPPNTRVRVERVGDGIVLRRPEDDEA